MTLSPRQVSTEAATRVWGELPRFRLFLSHRAEDRAEASRLKADLQKFGISAFVAHNDIHPTLQWQNEIENALATMDGLTALMTANFFESTWTNQEIGFAVARGVPIVPIRLDEVPQGFIAQIQALTSDWDEAPLGISRVLMAHDEMLDAFIAELANCSSFVMGNELALALPAIKALTRNQMIGLISAYNENPQLRGSFGFNGNKPNDHGPGLAHYLKRLTNMKFGQNSDGRIKILPKVI